MAGINQKQLQRLIILIVLRRRLRRQNEKYKKRFWMRKIYQERILKGEFHLLIKEIILFDHEYFFRCFRMVPATFEKLLSWVSPYIQKKTTKMREPVSPSERLSVTLRYLVTGDEQTSIAASYRISPSTIGRIIGETCQVLWQVLIEKGYLTAPKTKEHWKKIAREFETRWNFPHALGAIDGKHVVMQAPARSGSDYFNYKKTHSVVLMAICNADYEFTLVDIGDAGRQSDGSVYANSFLGHAIDNNLLQLPEAEKLDPSDPSSKTYPYVFVADDAFGLKTFMMKPYPGQNLTIAERVFNYRLSRARRIIENCFGVATSRFRVFRKPIIANVEKVINITKAVVVLHNFLMATRSPEDTHSYCPLNYTDHESAAGQQSGEWRRGENINEGIVPIPQTGSNNYSKSAKNVRDDFKEYFNSKQGAVSWQMDMVTRTLNTFDK
ncbi:Hypothetical predicted protein [Paramuricea clavata]|uniref:Uncharacterized protein n=1 Tax=Paramuricea clavata TaxID=317549 RepID=A0A6S7GSL1_PARCT|nr:Hypothetical predicted protein [Paramuricea clavata]